jgi:hypothetical protein
VRFQAPTPSAAAEAAAAAAAAAAAEYSQGVSECWPVVLSHALNLQQVANMKNRRQQLRTHLVLHIPKEGSPLQPWAGTTACRDSFSTHLESKMSM